MTENQPCQTVSRAGTKDYSGPDTVNAEEALRNIAAHPSSALRTWYSPEVLEQGIQLVSARYTYELFPSEVSSLASELVGVCHDLRAQEIKADRKAGIEHDVDQILFAHASSDQVSGVYTDEEKAEAVKVVRKRQGETTIDPHWVRMKLEQELREARAKADNK